MSPKPVTSSRNLHDPRFPIPSTPRPPRAPGISGAIGSTAAGETGGDFFAPAARPGRLGFAGGGGVHPQTFGGERNFPDAICRTARALPVFGGAGPGRSHDV